MLIFLSFPSRRLKALEEIVWPHLKAEIRSLIYNIKQEHSSASKSESVPVIVLEAAVLLDAGFDDILDGVWVVRAPPDVAIQRLVEYRSFTEDDAKKRIEAQKTRRGIGNVEKEVEDGVVTAVIENTGDLEALKEELLKKLNDSNAWKKP